MRCVVEVIATFAPCCASKRAVAKPMPRGLPAPVTSATFPEKFIFGFALPSPTVSSRGHQPTSAFKASRNTVVWRSMCSSSVAGDIKAML